MREKHLILFALLFIGCNNKIENKTNWDIISFNEYFSKFREKNVLTIFADVKGLSPRRAGEEMMIEFTDSTIVYFKFGNREIFSIEKKGSYHQKFSMENIYEKVKSIYEVFKDLKLNSMSFNDEQNIRSFSFNIQIIETNTLPKYEYPNNEFKKDTPIKKGYILYLYNDTYTKSYQFNLIKPLLLEGNWYFYTL